MDVDVLISKIPLVDENILEEAARQPMLFVEAARYRVDMMRKRAQAHARLDYLEARVDMIIRQRMRANDEKVTEAMIRSKIKCNKKVREAIAATDRAEEDEEFAKLLLDAFKQRRDAIRITAEAQVFEGLKGSAELDRLEERRHLRNTAHRVAQERQAMEKRRGH